MKTKYGIPQKDLDLIVARDKFCVYCHKKMLTKWDPKTRNQADYTTIEHLNHSHDWDCISEYIQKGKPISEIITICCGSCNSSRLDKPLREWFESEYCKDNNISYKTVSKVVKDYIDRYEP